MAVGDPARRPRGVEVGARRQVGLAGEQVVALGERLRVRDHGAQLGQRHPGQREQATIPAMLFVPSRHQAR